MDDKAYWQAEVLRLEAQLDAARDLLKAVDDYTGSLSVADVYVPYGELENAATCLRLALEQ